MAERTEDHERFFEEGREALLFDAPENLVEQARVLTADGCRREHIAMSGHRRVVRDGHTHGSRFQAILQAV